MSIRHLYIVLICNLFFGIGLQAQDFHFTQYELAPTLVNPAFTGQFAGTYRVNGVYRDQYRGFANTAFSTFSATVDVPIVRGIRKQDWIGGGINLNNGRAGVAEMQMSTFGMNVAYHLSLDKKQTRILSLGAQFSSGTISYGMLDASDTSHGLQTGTLGTTAMGFNGLANNNEMPGGSLTDLQMGLLYNIRGKQSDFKIGFSVEGILGPNRGLGAGLAENNKGIGLNGVVMYTQPVNKRTYLEHGLYYYSLDGASAFNLNSRVNYQINPEKDLFLVGGIGTRSARAALFFAGVKTGPWRVGLAYDLDLSSAVEGSSGHKAIELGVTYLGIINKRPKPDPIIYCPRI